MLFIEIPEGMEHTTKEFSMFVQRADEVRELTKNVLVDPRGIKPDINLQDIVQDYLKHRKKAFKVKSQTVQGLTFHPKPVSLVLNKSYLAYEPNNNGTKPAEYVKMGNKADFLKLSETSYGTRWVTTTPLSSERRSEVDQHDNEVREDRRTKGPKSQ